MAKTIEDKKPETELALAWAISAEDVLQRKSVFPTQIALVHNPNLPTVLTDLPSALKSMTSGNIV